MRQLNVHSLILRTTNTLQSCLKNLNQRSLDTVCRKLYHRKTKQLLYGLPELHYTIELHELHIAKNITFCITMTQHDNVGHI